MSQERVPRVPNVITQFQTWYEMQVEDQGVGLSFEIPYVYRVSSSELNTPERLTFAHSLMVILMGLSGAGKDGILEQLESRGLLQRIVTHTTRKTRPGEIDGVHYHFVNKETFGQMIVNHKFVEHIPYGVDDFKGTSFTELERVERHNGISVLRVEHDGAQRVLELWQGNQILRNTAIVPIFVMPESKEVLENRLRNRPGSSPEQVRDRLRKIDEDMRGVTLSKFVLLNVDGQLPVVAAQFCHIIRNELARMPSYTGVRPGLEAIPQQFYT